MYNNDESDTFLNIVLILLIIGVIWVILYNNKTETFNKMEQENNLPKVETTPSGLTVEVNPTPLVTTAPLNTITPVTLKKEAKPVHKYTDNLLGLDKVSMTDYNEKYYPTYAHQIKCPKKCGLSATGYECAQNADPIKMNLEAMTAANNKTCSTCTQNNMSTKYSNLPSDTIAQDNARLNKKKVSFDNINSYVDFNNVTNQDSLGLTEVDRMAEARTGTCDLSKYGTKISQVYDGLIGTSYKQTEKITQPLTGFYDGNDEGNIYAQPLSK